MVLLRFLLTSMLLNAMMMAGSIRAGYAKVDITPREPIAMGGYDLRGAPSDGVHGHDLSVPS